jgi:hypothetical protein
MYIEMIVTTGTTNKNFIARVMPRLKYGNGARPVSYFDRSAGLPVSFRRRAAFFSSKMGGYVSRHSGTVMTIEGAS